MPSTLAHGLATIAGIISIASVAYCLLCVWVASRFAKSSASSAPARSDLPPVSILKAMKGADPELYAALRSHCVLDYPDYEILFGVGDANDSAVPVIEKLIGEFPERKLRIVWCPQRLGANGKVSTLAQLTNAAANEVLLVNDSDIQVRADYLRTVIGELQQPGLVGLVTCLYRGMPAATLGSKLEALGIGTDFVPGVLVARFIERGMRFGLGSTLAFRKRDLQWTGGFEAIADYLADDYELGRRIAHKGLRVELSRAIVETHLPAYDLRGFFSHQLRWARTIRVSRPAGYAGLLFTFTLPWAALTVLLSRDAAWSWGLLAAALTARGAMAWVSAEKALRDKATVSALWLLPLRDFLAPVIWILGLAGRKIVWRGEVFTLRKGKLNSRRS